MTRMEEVKNKRIREVCLQNIPSEVCIWGTFENHPLDFLIDQIENDAESTERLVGSFL